MDAKHKEFAIGLVLMALSACAPAETTPSAIPSATAGATVIPSATLSPTIPAVPTVSVISEVLENSLHLEAAGKVSAFPGPQHYTGDVLTFEVNLDEFEDPGPVAAQLILDGGAPSSIDASWNFNQLLLLDALDTSELSGSHVVHIQAEGANQSVDVEYRLELLPADQRPAQEANAQWLFADADCCRVHYLTNSAAERDLDFILHKVESGVAEIVALVGTPLEDRLDIYLLDRMWGNGAFGGGGELATVYMDRNYGPAQGEGGLLTLFRHESVHAIGADYSNLHESRTFYTEGMAVFLAGGHYKPEPIPARGGAMLDLGYISGLQISGFQTAGAFIHEIAYLQGASLMAYIVEEYGWDALWQFRDEAVFETFFDPVTATEITQDIFGASYHDFEDGFLAWLAVQEPGSQIEDLPLTIELQELRRSYQAEFAVQPMFIFGVSNESFARPEAIPTVLREARAPANMALELMIANGQKSIVAGNYDETRVLIEAISDVLETGQFQHHLASVYAAAVELLAGEGYEVYELVLDEDGADVVVSRHAPELIELRLELSEGQWQIVE